MEIKYYTINESVAATANNINSFSVYEPGTATREYQESVDNVYRTVELIKERKPQYYERALYMADRYARIYAEYLNDYYRNEASCPSILITGGSNFPVSKKNKQNARRDTLMNRRNYITEYKNKIRNLLTMNSTINAADENALEMLNDKLEKRKADQEFMKKVNAYYRKHKTLEGCDDLTESQIKRYTDVINNSWRENPAVFETWQLSNNNAETRRLEDRIKKLETIKNMGTRETPAVDENENELFKVVENTELMRLQLLFEGKPSDAARDILKHHGFKWSPANQAWQRQLTDNAKWTLKHIMPELTKAL